jgi:Alkylmercury lyase
VSIGARPSDGKLPAGAAAALAAAEIPPSKLGAARPARLREPERDLYFWILRQFATRGRPRSGAIRDAAAELGLDGNSALATLAGEDLVHLGGGGEIAVAYPFSGRPTAHRVRFPSGHEAYAMCALDALGIAPMFDQTIAIVSRDPLSGEEIRVQAAPGGDAYWRPLASVVVTGAMHGQGDSCQNCCPVLNFFASAESGEHWLEDHPQVRGHVITIPEAVVAGRAIFGGVLEES